MSSQRTFMTSIWARARGASTRAAHVTAIIAVVSASSPALGDAAPAAPAAPRDDGTIRGEVVDATTHQPLVNAIVQLDGIDRLARSDERGLFLLRNVATGIAHLNARHLGYLPLQTTVVVRAGDTTEVTLPLREAATMLTPILVRPQLPEHEVFENGTTPGVLQLSQQDLRATPVALEQDLLRAVPLLPGVVARSDRNTGFSVQGGEEDQNLVLLDGIPLFSPDHFGGLFGTFIDGAVDHSRLQEAGFPARYGGRMSSVLDVTSAESARQGMHGSANLSLLSSSLTIGGATDDNHGSWNLALRRTYADLLMRAFTRQALPYHFSDVQGHATYELPSRTRLSVTTYRGVDVLDASMAELQDSTAPATARLLYQRGNRVVGIALTQPLFSQRGGAFGDSVVAELRASESQFASTFDQGTGSLTFESGVDDDRATGSLARFGLSNTLRAGYEYDQYRVHYRLASPQVGADELSGDQRLASLALFAEDEWRPTSRLVVQPGVRYEHLNNSAWSTVSPRLSVKYFVTPSFAVTAATGKYAQWLQLSTDETAPMQLFDYWVASDRSIPVAVARHFVAGAERWFGDSRFLRMEGFYKPYAGVNAQNTAADPAVPASTFLTERGTAYGATLFIRQLEVGKFAGWLSYTYGLTTRRHGDTTFYPLQDRRHTLNAVATLHSGRAELGMHFAYGSGTPFTPTIGDLQTRSYDPTTGSWEPGDPLKVQGPYDSRRYPAYSRLDLSVSRPYRWGSATVTPSLNVVNVYNRRNVFRYFDHYNTRPPTENAVTQLPILPTLGVKVDF